MYLSLFTGRNLPARCMNGKRVFKISALTYRASRKKQGNFYLTYRASRKKQGNFWVPRHENQNTSSEGTLHYRIVSILASRNTEAKHEISDTLADIMSISYCFDVVKMFVFLSTSIDFVER